MSFRKTLSNFLHNVQSTLFPMLENDLGKLSLEHKKLAAILELIRIEEYLPYTRFNNGRPCEDRSQIARAFIAKIVFKLNYTKQLIKLLKIDKKLKVICGWNVSETIPSESKFSRAFKEFSQTKLPETVHQALLKEIYKDQIVDHIVKDSMPLEVREKHVKKGNKEERRKKRNEKMAKKRRGELNRRQRQLKEENLDKMINDLPNLCDKGMKKSAQKYTKIWKGYKLHAAVDDHCIPIAVIVTSASLNDCEAAIPLATKAHQITQNYYDLMDAAYDHPEIKEHSISLGHIPVIDKCPQNASQKAEKEAEKKRKKHLNFQTAEDKRYRERFSKERFNAMYKCFHGGSEIFYRGHSKVSCHVMFGVLTLAASILINLIQ